MKQLITLIIVILIMTNLNAQKSIFNDKHAISFAFTQFNSIVPDKIDFQLGLDANGFHLDFSTNFLKSDENYNWFGVNTGLNIKLVEDVKRNSFVITPKIGIIHSEQKSVDIIEGIDSSGNIFTHNDIITNTHFNVGIDCKIYNNQNSYLLIGLGTKQVFTLGFGMVL